LINRRNHETQRLKNRENLKAAFAANPRPIVVTFIFANKADIEGQNDVAALFRSTAEGETGHAHGHLETWSRWAIRRTGLPIGSSRQNLTAAVARDARIHRYVSGHGEGRAPTKLRGMPIGSTTLAKAERSHANRFPEGLDALTD